MAPSAPRTLLAAGAALLSLIASPVASAPAATCSRTVKALQGDTCASIAGTFGITVTTFLRNNPDITSCGSLTLGATYCVLATEPSSSTTSSGSGPTGGLTVSTDGTCSQNGGKGFTCLGSAYGDCCSEHGWCGETDGHCGANCQPGFGLCKGGPSSSSSSPTTASSTTSKGPEPTTTITVYSTLVVTSTAFSTSIISLTTNFTQTIPATVTTYSTVLTTSTAITVTTSTRYLTSTAYTTIPTTSTAVITQTRQVNSTAYITIPTTSTAVITQTRQVFVTSTELQVSTQFTTSTHLITATTVRTAYETETTTATKLVTQTMIVVSTNTIPSTETITRTAYTTTTATKYDTSVITSISTLTMVVHTTKCGGSGPVQTPPSGTYPGMIENCQEFYRVRDFDTCESIARKHGITRAQFIRWNSFVGIDCGRLYPDFYACVSA